MKSTVIFLSFNSLASYQGHWLGLSYLLLDHGYPFHGAIQDALELGEFRLVLTLLSKINPSENHVLQRLDDNQRNLPLWLSWDDACFFSGNQSRNTKIKKKKHPEINIL